MALLRIDASGTEPLTAAGYAPWAALADHVHRLPDGAPLIVMTHGMRHKPGQDGADPHDGLLSPNGHGRFHWKSRSFARRLHVGRQQVLDGHGIAFGWDGMGQVWRAMARARRAGHALAQVTTHIRALRPDLRIGIVTHSLGARVVLEAMICAPVPVADRLLLLTPAEYRGRAIRALSAPGGRTTQVLATQTRENWVFSTLFAGVIPPWRTLAWGPDHDRWVDFVPERVPGLRIADSPARICHWSCYLRPGIWPAYRRWLTGDAQLHEFQAPPRPRIAPSPLANGFGADKASA